MAALVALSRDRPRRKKPGHTSSTFRRPPRRHSTCKPPVRIARCSHPSTTASRPLRPHPSQAIFPGTGSSGPKISSRVVLLGRAKRPRKADQVVQGNRMSIAGQVAPVFRKDLEVQVDRVFRKDLEVQVDRVVLVGPASPPTNQRPLVGLAKV